MSKSLNAIAKSLVEPGKGILAADESFGTIEKRFQKINLPSTEENRRAYREMLFATPGIGEYISGAILFDETIRDKGLVAVLEKAGVLPGIKVDAGTEAMTDSPEEKVTKGLEGLPERLKEYANLGAKFTKWRAVIRIGNGIPTKDCVKENAVRLARFAKFSQEAGLVPIVEPEVLMDGTHTIEKCKEVTGKVLKKVFEELKNGDVNYSGMLLKPNMVIAGEDCPIQVAPEEISFATLETLKAAVPAEVAGIVFLSGGQSEIEATENLNELNKLGSGAPWPLSFSFGRALQNSAMKAWGGQSENVKTAQTIFLHRAKMNSLATRGKYRGEND
jgi:fructose-bisphosphate aldolase class I